MIHLYVYLRYPGFIRDTSSKLHWKGLFCRKDSIWINVDCTSVLIYRSHLFTLKNAHCKLFSLQGDSGKLTLGSVISTKFLFKILRNLAQGIVCDSSKRWYFKLGKTICYAVIKIHFKAEHISCKRFFHHNFFFIII